MMKRLISGLLLLLLIGLPFSGWQVQANPLPDSLLTNPLNPHNMSNWATHTGPKAALVDGTDQICIFCHTPHGAEPVEGPLWNRPDPQAASFPLYGQNLAIKDNYGAGIQAAAQYGPTYGVYPNGSSRLCMSCHDGVTAIGAGLLRDGSDIAMTGTNLDGDGSLLTGLSTIIDLATSHPISFIYDGTIAGQIETAYDTQFGAGNYFQGPAAFDPLVRVYLDGQSRMQCTTCHDPHYANHLDAAGPNEPFWGNLYTTGYTNAYEAVCNQCHLGSPGSPSGDHNPGPGMSYP